MSRKGRASQRLFCLRHCVECQELFDALALDSGRNHAATKTRKQGKKRETGTDIVRVKHETAAEAGRFVRVQTELVHPVCHVLIVLHKRTHLLAISLKADMILPPWMACSSSVCAA